jgi:DNA-binding GntR family transcriptional regulator
VVPQSRTSNKMAASRDSLSKEIEVISLTERVIAALKAAFLSGRLKPGDAIVERHVTREMNVGTPVVREALISLKHQGFVRRINNKGSFVAAFDADQVRQLCALHIELETLALRWARSRVSEAELKELQDRADHLMEAGKHGDGAEFLKRDLEFHRQCWKLSGNAFLAETLERLTTPLFAFVVLASEHPMTAEMAGEHYVLIESFRSVQEPEFSHLVRKAVTNFAFRWISNTSAESTPGHGMVTKMAQPARAHDCGYRKSGSV